MASLFGGGSRPLTIAARSFVALSNYNDLDQASRNALDTMSREIRQTRSLTSYATNQLVFQDFDGAQLTYVWNPSPSVRTLSRIKGAPEYKHPAYRNVIF